MLNILITAGGTKEYIDDVRVLTNISTGKLAAEIASHLLMKNKFRRHAEPIINCKIHYVMAKGSAKPTYGGGSWSGFHRFEEIEFHEVSDVASLMKVMEVLVPQVDVVIHAMAVSDFGFLPASTKLKSNDPQAFIDSLRDRITVNPKVISFIKKWNPKVKLIGFKFEVGKTREELIEIAYESMVRNDCDYVIANDKKEMVEAGKHIAYLISKDKSYQICDGKNDIAEQLLKTLNL